jgi:MraZ protein
MGKMGFFSGKYRYSLDEKNRINFKKILNRFGAQEGDPDKIFHLYKDYVKVSGAEKEFPVFYIFPEDAWREFYEMLESEYEDDKLSEFSSFQCDEASLDNMNRIMFPKEFLRYIQASKNLFIQGLGGKLQVWSQENFDAYSDEMTKKRPAHDFHGILNKRKKNRMLT